MQNLSTGFLIVLLSFCFTQESSGQANDRLLKSRGYSMQWTKLPLSLSTFFGQVQTENLNQAGIGYTYNFRYNLFEAGDNSAIGLGVGISAGLEFGANLEQELISAGAVYLPIDLNYNYGAGSTYDTDQDFGIAIGLGVTPSYLPIFSNRSISKLNSSPSLNLAIRQWVSGSNALKEYFFRFDKIPTDLVLPVDEGLSSFTLTLGVKGFIGY